MHHARGDVPRPDSYMCPVPSSTATTDFDFGTEERRRRADDGSADVPPDVQEDAAPFAWSREMEAVHGYGATDTGVTDGFV